MNDVMDRRARKEIAEEENRLKGVQLDNDKAYRDGVLANDKARIAADTAELNWAKIYNLPNIKQILQRITITPLRQIYWALRKQVKT